MLCKRQLFPVGEKLIASGGWVKKISFDNDEGRWIVDVFSNEKTMANYHASKVGGKLEFDSRLWCSLHTEDFCNQGKCAACVNENFWSFSLSTKRPKNNLGYFVSNTAHIF
jgi:hypothetical protein